MFVTGLPQTKRSKTSDKSLIDIVIFSNKTLFFYRSGWIIWQDIFWSSDHPNKDKVGSNQTAIQALTLVEFGQTLCWISVQFRMLIYTHPGKRGKGRVVRPMFGKQRCPLPGCKWRPRQPPASPPPPSAPPPASNNSHHLPTNYASTHLSSYRSCSWQRKERLQKAAKLSLQT